MYQATPFLCVQKHSVGPQELDGWWSQNFLRGLAADPLPRHHYNLLYSLFFHEYEVKACHNLVWTMFLLNEELLQVETTQLSHPLDTENPKALQTPRGADHCPLCLCQYGRRAGRGKKKHQKVKIGKYRVNEKPNNHNTRMNL